LVFVCLFGFLGVFYGNFTILGEKGYYWFFQEDGGAYIPRTRVIKKEEKDNNSIQLG
jgi:hypothetical protein